MKRNLKFQSVVKDAAPNLRILQIEADVNNHPTADALWLLIEEEAEKLKSKYETPQINKIPAIAATRKAYKALGKDPNRYRPSSESLSRRAVNGKGLYRLTTIVDLINLISMRTGHSIGGFDADNICGETITLGRGEADEPFEGIGRGVLNIEGLPVWRDEIGGIGTPTSDNERTKLTENTQSLLMLVNIYDDQAETETLTKELTELLHRFANARNVETRLWSI